MGVVKQRRSATAFRKSQNIINSVAGQVQVRRNGEVEEGSRTARKLRTDAMPAHLPERLLRRNDGPLSLSTATEHEKKPKLSKP